jgi:TPR repeat protein
VKDKVENASRATARARDDYEKALREMRSQKPNVRRALTWLQRAYKAGSADATYALATWYLFGQEPYIKQDIKHGNDMLRMAAAAGHGDALYDLGASYEMGVGLRKNTKKAFELYVRAALRGDAVAVNEVARCYHFGIGIAKDRRLSKIWYERARELGTEE